LSRVATVELLTPAGATARTLALCRRLVPGRWALWRARPAPLSCFEEGWVEDVNAPVCAVRVSLAPAGEAVGHVRVEATQPQRWRAALALCVALVVGLAALSLSCCCACAVTARAWLYARRKSA